MTVKQVAVFLIVVHVGAVGMAAASVVGRRLGSWLADKWGRHDC